MPILSMSHHYDFHFVYEVYVPIMYILMTAKTQALYWHAFSQLVVLSKWKLNVNTFTSDFKRALMNAAKHHMPEGLHVGCLFHLKQAWRRYLITQLGFLAGEIALAMTIGVLDLLSVIPKDEVEEYGIPFVRSVIEATLNKKDIAKWAKFWKYFKKQWMPILDSCNISDIVEDIHNRTNNGLESYNRRC